MTMRPTGRKPAPFQRPGIDIGHHGREWKDVLGNTLRRGDIVAGKGLIVESWPVDEYPWVEIEYFNGEVDIVGEALVKAFVRKDYNG